MTQPHTTKAGDWLQARAAGRQLPEHELTDQFACDLCGEAADYTPDAEGAESVTGLWICIPCVETTLQAGVIQ